MLILIENRSGMLIVAIWFYRIYTDMYMYNMSTQSRRSSHRDCTS